MALPDASQIRIGVVGLGYVGLPLAVAFGRLYPTVGFDATPERIRDLRAGKDRNGEVAATDLAEAGDLTLTDQPEDLTRCTVYAVTVPTPIDHRNQPDLSHLEAACRTVGSVLAPGDVVVVESTVYPGATEEVCLPLLEAASGLHRDRDFHVGYSPERINPGDSAHRLAEIVKVVAGRLSAVTDFLADLYGAIIPAGIHKAESIRVAEAAKAIENTQRDVNIALMNELTMLLHELGIDTDAVLRAAATKWNFLPFRPGLAGGHCIGVDPYYLLHKAQAVGFHPQMIQAGRGINDRMGAYVAERVAKLLAQRQIPVLNTRVLILGATYKPDCADPRNSRISEIIAELTALGAQVAIHDPHADPETVTAETGQRPVDEPTPATYAALILAVPHRAFLTMGAERIRAWGQPDAILFDVKAALPAGAADGRL